MFQINASQAGLILLLILFGNVFSHSPSTDHWEMIVYDYDNWKYFVGSRDPGSDWYKTDYNDIEWLSGPGGIGYEDGDDRTIIEPTISLYMRITFSVNDTSIISSAIFNMDYDDAFVAYLNEIEIARANIGNIGDHPSFDQPANTWREAMMHQGGNPEYYHLDKSLISTSLREGQNVLAIQVHNSSIESSDLSAIPYFSVGITNSSVTYRSTPEWFNAPLDFSSSNLPIIIIDTNGQSIMDDPRIVAKMGIIDNGEIARNYITDSFNDYDGLISIEVRGQSSQMFPKKSYAIETQLDSAVNNNVSLLGMPIENDWILYAPYSDKSLLRNMLSFHLGRSMDQYASRLKFCELVINGDYKGIYILMEKIKRDNNRVNIATLRPEDISGDQLTGGYIIKVDKEGDEFNGWLSLVNPPKPGWRSLFYQYHDPEYDELMPEQKQYIQDYMNDFESALVSDLFKDPDSGYMQYIDTNSFVDHFILRELSKEIDSYKFSTFMYKDRDSLGGKLKMGPFWDFNLGYGNVDFGHERAMFVDGWMYNQGTPHMYWWDRMMEDDLFKNTLKTRWLELRSGVFHSDSILNYLENMSNYIEEARERNFNLWPILGKYVWPNYYVGQTYSDEYKYLKDWILVRLDWMDKNMPGKDISSTIEHQEIAAQKVSVSSYPNPFTSSTHIKYKINVKSDVSIQIFDILGRKIKTLTNFSIEDGMNSVAWNGNNESGRRVTPGIYFYVIHANHTLMATGKLLKIK